MKTQTFKKVEMTLNEQVQKSNEFSNKFIGVRGAVKTVFMTIVSLTTYMVISIAAINLMVKFILWVFAVVGIKSIPYLLAIFMEIVIIAIGLTIGITVGGAVFLSYSNLIFKAEKGQIVVYVLNLDRNKITKRNVFKLPKFKIFNMKKFKEKLNDVKESIKSKVKPNEEEAELVSNYEATH